MLSKFFGNKLKLISLLKLTLAGLAVVCILLVISVDTVNNTDKIGACVDLCSVQEETLEIVFKSLNSSRRPLDSNVYSSSLLKYNIQRHNNRPTKT